MGSYSASEVVAVRVLPFREDAEGVYSWWCRDMLAGGVEGGGFAVDATTAFEAARIFAGMGEDGRVLAESFRLTPDYAEYDLAV